MQRLFKPTQALLALAVVLAPTVVHGQIPSGTLDTSFGAAGKVTTDFAALADFAASVAVQPDGKFVVAGTAYANVASDFALARYNSNGTLDASFGWGGKVTTDFAGSWDGASAVAVQTDGKIVAAGQAVVNTIGDLALARYNSDGTLDASFGWGGRVTTEFAGVSGRVSALTVQPDGKIVVAGVANIDGGYDFAMVRYNSDGTLDVSFGSGGKVTTDFGLLEQGFSFAQALSVAIQTDGKIVAAGYAYMGAGYDFALARYNSNGSLDATFGAGGKVTTDFPSPNDRAFAVAVQPDGKIVAAGLRSADFALARYNGNGSLDATFGTSGKVTTDFAGSSDAAFSLTVQTDAKVIAAGRTFIGAGFHSALARYNSNGTLDTNFGTAGKVTVDFGGITDGLSSVVIQAGGKILAAGSATFNEQSDFAVVQVVGTTPAPTTTAMTPVRVNTGGSGLMDPTGVAWAGDNGFTGGSAYGTTASIAGTATPALYQTERWASNTLQYQFAAVNGTRTVNLKFAEIYFDAPGQRVFNIVINGQMVESNFDVFVAAGGSFKAVDKSYTVNIAGGAVTIQLIPVVSNPKISGLEIF